MTGAEIERIHQDADRREAAALLEVAIEEAVWQHSAPLQVVIEAVATRLARMYLGEDLDDYTIVERVSAALRRALHDTREAAYAGRPSYGDQQAKKAG